MNPPRDAFPSVADPLPEEPLIPIGRLAPGQTAWIRRIVGRAADVHRLQEFGLRIGSRIQMFRPGNPCIVRLNASKVCLRADDSLAVLVAPIGG